MKTIHVIVKGRVQGVFFRTNTQKAANDIGITGWVKNLDNGCVEIEAQGSDEKVNEFISFLKKGSPGARVDKVSIEEIPAREFSGFSVR